MNREMRRHGPQLKPKPTAAQRKPPAIRPAPAATPPARTAAAPRAGWLREIWSEIKKVQWPSRSEAWNLTLVVLLVSVALGVALGGIDTLFGWLMQNTILK
jgi:preprotein translocase SecE subunit